MGLIVTIVIVIVVVIATTVFRPISGAIIIVIVAAKVGTAAVPSPRMAGSLFNVDLVRFLVNRITGAVNTNALISILNNASLRVVGASSP
jgi:hypothetical protein